MFSVFTVEEEKEAAVRLYYSFGGGKPRIYLDTRVHFVTPGTLIFTDRHGFQVPILTLQYDLRDLGPVSAILGAMQVRKEDPEVYIWDEEKAEPEVAILFRTQSPDKAVLDELAGKMGEMLNDVAAGLGCEHLSTMAEVNLRKLDVDKLISEFDVHRVIAVEVRETGSSEDEPLCRFVSRSLLRAKPRLED